MGKRGRGSEGEGGPSRARALLVGDGDLSFSLALSRAFASRVAVTATVLEGDAAELGRAHARAAEHADELRAGGHGVLYGVDAARLGRHAEVAAGVYDCVAFNLPHLGDSALAGGSEAHAVRHRALLAHFFHGAKALLARGGRVVLTLVGEQPEAWAAEGAARRAGLALASRAAPARYGAPASLPGLPPPPPLGEAPRAWAAQRAWRTGALGETHWAARYGYEHRRHGDDGHMRVTGLVQLAFENAGDAAPLPSGEGDGGARLAGAGRGGCGVCGASFATEGELLAHEEAPALPDVRAACPQCGKGFSSEYAKEQHLGTCRGRRPSKGSGGAAPPPPAASSPPLPGGAGGAGGEETVVVAGGDGSRLWKWARENVAVPGSAPSKGAWKKACAARQVLVNGQGENAPAEAERIVREGDRVSIAPGAFAPQAEAAAAAGLDLRYVDADVVVVWKPAGMRVRGAHPGTVEATLREMFAQCDGWPEAGPGALLPGPLPLSRLEIGCSGLVIAARTESGRSRLEGRVEHTFRALTKGAPAPGKMTGGGLACCAVAVLGVRGGGGGAEGAVAEVEVATAEMAGRCCGAICSMLRERGIPVLGDRNAPGGRGGSAGGMHSKLQVACVRVRGEGVDVASEPPKRFKAVLRGVRE